MNRHLAAVAALALFVAGPALAQSDQDVISAFQAYNEAYAAGDLDAAQREAERAYAAAEAVWGEERPETGILAMNLGSLVARDDDDRAADLFQRCIEILSREPERAPADLAFCHLALGSAHIRQGEERRARRAFQDAVDVAAPYADSSKEMATMAGRAMLQLAALEVASARAQPRPHQPSRIDVERLNARMYVEARKLAEEAEAFLTKGGDTGSPDLGTALIFQAYDYETREEWGRAAELYTRAEPMLDGATEAQRVAMNRASFVRAQARIEAEDDLFDEDPGPDCKFKNTPDGVAKICWSERPPPRFPSAPGRRGSEGFVLVAFDLTAAGEIRNPRVVDSWPGEEFDRAALSSVDKWRYEPPVLRDTGEPLAVDGVEVMFQFFISD